MFFLCQNMTDENNNISIFTEDRFEPCRVCGEPSSGWHCGAVTCEACKVSPNLISFATLPDFDLFWSLDFYFLFCLRRNSFCEASMAKTPSTSAFATRTVWLLERLVLSASTVDSKSAKRSEWPLTVRLAKLKLVYFSPNTQYVQLWWVFVWKASK